jgi:hypothetical protein
MSSGKQVGGTTVLREWHDIVTRETCIPASLNINNLGKAAVLHPALLSSVARAGRAKLSLSLSTAVFMSNSHRLLIICSPKEAG